MRLFFGFILLWVASACINNKTEDKGGVAVPKTAPQPIFSSLSPSKTNINFNNTLQENLSTLDNLFDYDYFYNGAGVGLEDINNDGLLDIFFCGNQVPNKLYLNKGNFVFEDISEQAGINQGKIWTNGVTFVDINQDGWMDIYLSQGGPNQRLQRKNLLFLNQQDNTFKEVAEEMGLADMGISTQSAFLDYDKDGDLDLVVMNENEYYGVDPITLGNLITKNEEAAYFNSSHFYENSNGKYVDATKKVGLNRPIFGLGLSIHDFNGDMWPDIYIASDYYLPDALFINNQNGSFTDEIKTHTNQISFYGMGMDVADINNDTHDDIFVLDMAASDHKRSKTLMASMDTKRFEFLTETAKFHHQYMYNSLQLNTGTNQFNNIAHLTETANTDWSWSVLMSDFDFDEDKDIYITNGYRRYALDNDSQRKVFQARQKYGRNVPLSVKKQLYNDLPTEKLPNILYQNHGDLRFQESAATWGLADYTYSNGAATGDLDNDGDLDLVINNLDDVALVYQNHTMERENKNYIKIQLKGNHSEQTAKVVLNYNGKQQAVTPRRVRGYRSSQEKAAYFGLGNNTNIDSIDIIWDTGKKQTLTNIAPNTTVEANINAATKTYKAPSSTTLFEEISTPKISHTHIENPYNDFEKEILLPYKQSSLGPLMSKGDANGDGLEDVYIGGSSGHAGQLFIQGANGFSKKRTIAFELDKDFEDMESVFFDFDGDNDLDLLVASGGNEFEEHSSLFQNRLYENDGKGNFNKVKVKAFEEYPKNSKTVAIIDFDDDGDADILIGNRVIPKNYPTFQPSSLYKNEQGTFVDVTQEFAPGLLDFGIINKLLVTDFNSDGKEDFIAVGEWTGIGFFENKDGRFVQVKEESKNPGATAKGWWFTAEETDVNKDGLKDYVIGNVGQNLKFKASKEKPLKVYANDFDDNGTTDVVLSKKYNGEYVPVRGRECSSQQMPFISEKFETYSEFADAKLIDIYGDKLDKGYAAEATEFRSVLLINQGDGVFSLGYLPIEAQFIPNLSYCVQDLNHDGFEDIVVTGNIYETEVETPRLDAYSGIVLISNQKDGYSVLAPSKSGLIVNGNIKDAIFVEHRDQTLLLTAQNNGKLQLFQWQDQ